MLSKQIGRELPSGIVKTILVSLQTDGSAVASRKAFRLLKSRVAARIRSFYPLLNIEAPLRNPDREFLEQTIFPWLRAANDVQKILFVGVEYCTWHYKKQFYDKEFYTIDVDERLAVFGNGDLHVVGSVLDLKKFFANNFFDAVVLNGVLGYGLNSRQQVNAALVAIYGSLRTGGKLIVGWDNDPKFIDFPLEELKGYKLFAEYIPTEFGLRSNRIEVNPDNRHTFDFLCKQAAD